MRRGVQELQNGEGDVRTEDTGEMEDAKELD
jgi:hypothetical protein